MRVELAKYNGTGSVALLVSSDEFDTVELVKGKSLSAKQACRQAAERLRDAANRFERLAEEAEPYKSETHDRINRKGRSER
jgi:hypothetical protein